MFVVLMVSFVVYLFFLMIRQPPISSRPDTLLPPPSLFRSGAGDDPIRCRQLLPLLPIGRGPDVLGMRGATPRQPGQQGGIACDRGGRMQEMRVQPEIGRAHV